MTESLQKSGLWLWLVMAAELEVCSVPFKGCLNTRKVAGTRRPDQFRQHAICAGFRS